MWLRYSSLIAIFILMATPAGVGEEEPISWKEMLRQPSEWYASEEAVRIGDNLLLFQRASGGWPKNTDMTRPLSEEEKERLRERKSRKDSTLDNGATHTEMGYLARVYSVTGLERFREGFRRGLEYLLEAQYENGGFPQFYPLRGGYSDHITFNDNAMIGALTVLRKVAREEENYTFVDEERRVKAEKALEKGIECILDCQIEVDEKLTVWCAQHHRETLKPEGARSYEHPSLSGSESVGVVGFLMGMEPPTERVKKAIESAVEWFKGPAKIEGIRKERVEVEPWEDLQGRERTDDIIIVKDPEAPTLWARFYEIETNRPIFSARDGVVRYDIAEITPERRMGYGWYGGYARQLLEKDYPRWKEKWGEESQK